MILSFIFLTIFILAFISFHAYFVFILKKPLPEYDNDLLIEIENYTQNNEKTENIQKISNSEKAFVFCSPYKTFENQKTVYAGYKDCSLFKKYHESDNPCTWACFGFGSCIPHCPQDAIILVNNTAVITDSCNGCGICVDFCPNNVIKMLPNCEDYLVACSSHDGEQTHCSHACTACAICVDNMYYSGFKIKDNLAVSDYKPNNIKAQYAQKCPQKSIVKITFPRKNDFKFWAFWYTIRNRMAKKSNGN